jgi:hypothetical protein
MPTLWRCDECDHRLTKEAMVVHNIPHPKPGFASVPVHQCPECGAVGQFVNVCDEPECHKDASCGWPSPEGYRRTCGDHWKRN